MKRDILPVDVQTEKILLGSILLDPSFLDSLRSTIEPDDFAIEKHRRIWRRVCEVYDAGNSVDRITVCTALDNAGEKELVGGLTYLMELDHGLPVIPNVDSYVRLLKDKSLRRKIILTAQNIALHAQRPDESVDAVLDSLSTAAVRLTEGSQIEDPLVSTKTMLEIEGIDKLLGPRRMDLGVRLPWSAMQAALAGFVPSQLIVLLGETSRGKTCFALQAACHAAAQGYAVLYWTMEMSRFGLYRRLIAQLSGVPVPNHPGTHLTADEREAHRTAAEFITEHPITFDSRARTVAAFSASVRRMRAKARLGLVVVDHLQLIRGTDQSTRAREVGENSRSLKLAAMDFDVPILALSQVDRASLRNGEIGLHSAKESGDIENDADVLLWVKAAEEFSRDNETFASIHVGKQREGPAGFDIPMVFRPKSQTFMEVQ